MISTLSTDALITERTPGIGRRVRLWFTYSYMRILIADVHPFQLFRIFFGHLKTTITNIDIYLNEQAMDRDMKVSLSDFKKVVEDFREKLKGNPGTSKLSEDTISDCVQTLESLGINLDQFSKDTSDLVGIMSNFPRAYSRRADKSFGHRLVATSGLQWNAKSKNVARDYMMAAMATRLESLMVPNYRVHLVQNCPGAASMRKEFEDYFKKIAKPNMVKATSGDQGTMGKPITKRTWFFADRIKSSVGVEVQGLEPEEFRTKLEESHQKFAQRKNDRILRLVDVLVKCPYFLCTKEGVAPGTLESTAYYLITALCRVSLHLQASHRFHCHMRHR